MTPNVKGLIGNGVTGVVAIVGTLIVTSMFTAAEQGSEALEAQRITAIVEAAIEAKMNVVIDGKTYTYGEALSLIHSEQVALTAAFEVLIAD